MQNQRDTIHGRILVSRWTVPYKPQFSHAFEWILILTHSFCWNLIQLSFWLFNLLQLWIDDVINELMNNMWILLSFLKIETLDYEHVH